MNNVLICIGTLLLMTMAFNRCNRPTLDGQWVADAVIDLPSDTLDINSSEVGFEFVDNQYRFTSTLSYSESGVYDHSKDCILLTPYESSSTNRVEIIEHTANFLKLKIKNGDSDRILVLSRL